MAEFTKGEWKVTKSPFGDWVIATEDTLICREVRHFNTNLIAASPRMARLLERLVNDGWNASISEEAREILQTLA